MIIEGYLFSEKARMINNIYYGIVEHNNSNRIYYNISDYDFALMKLNTFVYKVKVDSNDAYSVTPSHIEAVKYQVKEELNFNEWIKAAQFTEDEFGQDKIEWDSIIDGSMPNDEVLSIYNKIMLCQPWALSFTQIIKLHAILNQKIYNLPILKLVMWNKEYARVYEFYHRKYEIDYNVYIVVREEFIEREALYGSKNFESINSKDNSIQLSNLYYLIETRKFTQNEFEACWLRNISGLRIDDEYKAKFIRVALVANYNIPTEYRDIYPVVLMLKYPELATKLTHNNIGDPSCISRLLMLGYKIKGKDYKGKYIPILNARKIMRNDNYKYIKID